MEFEIKYENRGLTYYENVKGSNILEVIGKFYGKFGYQRIMQIRTVE